jgi:hypothetical protein
MIIRIMGEGQYDVPDEAADPLNALDEQVETAVESGDDDAFAAALVQLLELVRSQGTAIADNALVESDGAVPPADATVAEVAEMLGDEGLIPGRSPG